MSNLIKIDDLTTDEFFSILKRADYLCECWKTNSMPKTLCDKKIALWFYGQGFRNRVAFEIGARSLGADVSFIPGELGIHEPIEDIAYYLNNWFSMVVIRCKNYSDLTKIVSDSKIPIINARTSFNHPCEVIGDLEYINRKRNSLDGLKVVFVGEMTNLCMSWFEAARILPIEVIQLGPKKYLASTEVINKMNENAKGKILVTDNIDTAITKETDVIYTDCWPKCINTEKDNCKNEISNLFLPYQITKQIINKMNPSGFFMPCPPITRGEEISEDSVSTEQYCDYAAKEFLLHSQNAVMEFCFGVN